MLRLEVLAQELILQHETFDQMVDAYVAAVESARSTGHVALKSIIAYRTGLALQRNQCGRGAGRDLGRVKEQATRDGKIRLAHKPLNDYLVLTALAVAERQQLPVQFHTGFGDTDLDLLLANPLHLRPVLESGKYTHVPFVLLHASYPYVREAGLSGRHVPQRVDGRGAGRAPYFLRDPGHVAPNAGSHAHQQGAVLHRRVQYPGNLLAGCRGGDGGGWAKCSTS